MLGILKTEKTTISEYFIPYQLDTYHTPGSEIVMGFEYKSSHKDFMPDPRVDPNDYYRPWLEKIVGKQGEDWQWILFPSTNSLVFYFKKEEHAVLFELTWA